MEEPSDIQKLLRLKRYEQPPAGHTEQFLHEFQRRQRSELLQRSSWKIGLERLQVYLRECGIGNLAYAGATAGLLVFAASTALKLVDKPNVAVRPAPKAVQVAQVEPSHLALDSRTNVIFLSPVEAVRSQATTEASRPRYVIDARPASYEPPASF